MPPIKESNYDYIAGVLWGDIKVCCYLYQLNLKHLKYNQVKPKIVPMIEDLRVKDILLFARENVNIDKYLPAFNKNKVPDRSFLWNMCIKFELVISI